jgi:hypothetical protein
VKRVLLVIAAAGLVAAVATSIGTAASSRAGATSQNRFVVKTAAFQAVGGSGVSGRVVAIAVRDQVLAVAGVKGLTPLAAYTADSHSDASCTAGGTLLANVLAFHGFGLAIALVKADIDTIGSIGVHAPGGALVACADLQHATTLRLARAGIQKLERRFGLPAVAPRRR